MTKTADVISLHAELSAEHWKDRFTHFKAESGLEGSNRVVQIAAEFDGRVAKIRQDPDLSPAGQQRQIQEAGYEALRELTAFEVPKLAGLDSHREQLSRQIDGAVSQPRVTDPLERVQQELRLQPLLAELRGLDTLERTALYETTTNEDVIAALESAPPSATVKKGPSGFREVTVTPLVDPEVVAKRRLKKGTALKPETAERIDEIDALRTGLSGLIDTARREISKVANIGQTSHTESSISEE